MTKSCHKLSNIGYSEWIERQRHHTHEQIEYYLHKMKIRNVETKYITFIMELVVALISSKKQVKIRSN